MRIGYARVSKREQNLAMQLKALRAAGCTRIYTDKESGLARSRPARAKAVAALRDGDQLIVWKLDRFSRDLLDQLLTLRDLQMRGASLVSLTEGVTTTGWRGSIRSRQYALYAEAELLRITERTRAGVAAALERGVKFGRRPKMSESQTRNARRLMDRGMKAEAVAVRYGVGRATLFRHLRRKTPATLSD
jgi:DNA invertase Pin-like site-specific DNA recombinase